MDCDAGRRERIICGQKVYCSSNIKMMTIVDDECTCSPYDRVAGRWSNWTDVQLKAVGENLRF